MLKNVVQPGSICPPRCETLMTISAMPARASAWIIHTMSGLPPAGSSGLGVMSVRGRIRSPRPAARIIAFMSSERVSRARRALLECVEEPHEGSQLGIAPADRARVFKEARRVVEIAGFAVAVMDARENAEHLEVPLQAHPFEIAVKRAKIGVDRQSRPLARSQ